MTSLPLEDSVVVCDVYSIIRPQKTTTVPLDYERQGAGNPKVVVGVAVLVLLMQSSWSVGCWGRGPTIDDKSQCLSFLNDDSDNDRIINFICSHCKCRSLFAENQFKLPLLADGAAPSSA